MGFIPLLAVGANGFEVPGTSKRRQHGLPGPRRKSADLNWLICAQRWHEGPQRRCAQNRQRPDANDNAEVTIAATHQCYAVKRINIRARNARYSAISDISVLCQISRPVASQSGPFACPCQPSDPEAS